VLMGIPEKYRLRPMEHVAEQMCPDLDFPRFFGQLVKPQSY
jgi:hypothetical protein